MKERPPRPWRQLVPLALVVLAVHLALLLPQPERIAPADPAAVRFQTRVVDPPQPLAPVAEAAPPPPAPVAAPPAPSGPPSAKPARVRTQVLAAAPAAAEPAPAAEASGPIAPAAPVAVAAAESAPAPPPKPAAAAAPARSFLLPPSMRLRYEVRASWKGFPITCQGRLDWRQDGQQYEARLEVSSTGLPSRIQRSTGRIDGDGLAPSYFSDKARSEQATHFEREQGRLVFSNNQPPAPILPGMQDRLSVVLQLAALVAGQPARFVPGTEIAIPTASTREAETWTFTVEGEEDLALPGGKVRALKLQRLPRKQYDQKVELWLAPGMDYAPVRLRLTNPGGDAVDQRWASTDRG